MRKKNTITGDDAAVDMTPMLDIVFIMLIFFIVSSTFLHESGLGMTEHKKNKKNKPETPPAKAIILRICSSESVLIDERTVDIRAVRANVERKLAEESRALVIIETEAETPTQLLVLAMDQVREANASLSVSPLSVSCHTEYVANT